MSIERPNIFESEKKSESLERKRLRVANEIQKEIMGFMCSPDQGLECFDGWVDDYADSFRIIFNEVLERDSEFLDKWDNDIDERNVSLDFFMEELRKLDGPKQGRAA